MRPLCLFILLQSLSSMLLANNLPEKLAICSSCHNINGVSSNPQWPNLAHQSKQYMVAQLKAYKSGQRNSAIMQAYAKMLSDDEILQLADYYAKQPRPQAQALISSKGEQLYRLGDYKRGIPACSACHGPKGYGNDPAKYPALAGQQSSYLLQQLQAFKAGQRTEDSAKIMQRISQRLTEQDMKYLVAYMQTLS